MEPNPSWESANYAATQEFPSILKQLYFSLVCEINFHNDMKKQKFWFVSILFCKFQAEGGKTKDYEMHGNKHFPNLVFLILSQIHIGYLTVFPKYFNFVMFFMDLLATSICIFQSHLVAIHKLMYCLLCFYNNINSVGRSQWPRGLRNEPS
jgi:hypothetical protein